MILYDLFGNGGGYFNGADITYVPFFEIDNDISAPLFFIDVGFWIEFIRAVPLL